MSLRLAILADIHGNMPALEAVVRDMQPFQADHVIVAGDVINVGPFSDEVLSFVIEAGWSVIRGNHEYYLLDYGTPRAMPRWTANPSTYTFMPGLRQELYVRWGNQIAFWPDSLCIRLGNALPLRIVHGTARSPFEAIQPTTDSATLDAMFAGTSETTIITAHTHRPLDMQIGTRHILNPGSVGWSLDGNRAASYMILDGDEQGWTASLRRVEYDITPLIKHWDEHNAFHDWGVFKLLMRDEFLSAQDLSGHFAAWHAQKYPNELFLTEHVEAFLAGYPHNS